MGFWLLQKVEFTLFFIKLELILILKLKVPFYWIKKQKQQANDLKARSSRNLARRLLDLTSSNAVQNQKNNLITVSLNSHI